jgi:hypothetical protein
LLYSACGMAQAPTPVPVGELNLALTYNALQANVVQGSRFWMNGSSAQVAVHIASGWSVIGDAAGQHTGNMASTGTGLDLFTLTFGPQFAVQANRAVFFGQGRYGLSWGRNSLFPNGSSAPTSDLGAAIAIGGGVDLALSHRLSVRVVQAEWSRTELNNLNANGQNSLRLSAGMVFRFR